MKPIRHLAIGTALTALLTLTYSSTQAKNVVEKKAYMFGFSASFNDSIIYFTNIQEVDSVWFTQKKGMLAGRREYSGQLRDYCKDKLNQPQRTCIVIGDKQLKKVEKKYEKMKKMYSQSKKTTYDVRFIPDEEFKFSAVNMSEGGEGTNK
ncbi:MAG: hypothetical protein IJV25_02110 [Prevotella sp.]|nr:hypothetical protein [Prevotella sp.]MBQ9649192.1 hypothetical protein [Prevotella sp.]